MREYVYKIYIYIIVHAQVHCTQQCITLIHNHVSFNGSMSKLTRLQRHVTTSVADPEGVLGVPWNPPFDKTTTVHVLLADSVLVLTESVMATVCLVSALYMHTI